MAESERRPGKGNPSGGPNDDAPKWDKDQDGVPDVLNDPATRTELMRKYGYTEDDLRTKAKRDLFYQAVRKDFTRKEAKAAYGEVYVNDEASVPDIIEQSGFTMELIKAYPELRDVFRKLSDMLARGKITEDKNAIYAKFQELIGDTAFGRRTTSEILADLDRYKKDNKQNWDKRVSDMVRNIETYLKRLNGGTIDSASATDLALKMIYAGEETNSEALARRVREWLGTGSMGDKGGTDAVDYGGSLGTYQDQLTRWFASNGLTVSKNELDKWLLSIDSGAETVDSVKQWYRDKRLAVNYASYADEFAKGFDLTDVASGYMASMSNILEKNMADISLDDPYLKRALQYTDDSGKPRKMTGWEFERLLRDSPEWQKTNNAMSVYTDIGEGILRSFGFRG